MSEEEQAVEQIEEPAQEAVEQAEPEQAEPEQGNSLYSSLFDIAEQEEKSEEVDPGPAPSDVISLSDAVDKLDSEEPVAEEPAQEEPVAEEAQGEEPEKSEPKKKKVKQVIDPDLPSEVANELTEEAPAQQEDPDQEFVESLLPEEQEIYKLAKYASEKMEGYDGADKQFKKYIDSRLKEDPHVNLAEDEDYKRFIANAKPKFSNSDARKVEQEMLLEKAETRAREKLKPEIERVRREQEKINLAPIVHEKKAQAQALTREIIPEEFRETLSKENGLEEFAKTKPMEYAALDAVSGQVLASANLLVDITTGNTQYDPNNPEHEALLSWVNSEQENFIQSGQTQRDGKIFMRRERYFQLPEAKRSEYYSWSDDDLVRIIVARGQEALGNALNQQQEMLKAYGVAQAPQSAPAPKAPVRQQAPSIGSSPRPSPETPVKTEQKNPLFNALGM